MQRAYTESGDWSYLNLSYLIHKLKQFWQVTLKLLNLMHHCRAPFFDGYKFCKGTKKGSLRKLLSRIYIGYAHVVRWLFSHRDIIYTYMHKHNIHKFEVKLYTSKAIHLYWISSITMEQVSQMLATIKASRLRSVSTNCCCQQWDHCTLKQLTTHSLGFN